MTNKVKQTIKKYKMLCDGEKVLVGLSGGADSISLLLALKMLGYEVYACHVNHQLRGEESERDQRFCEDICNRENIRLFVEKIDVNTFCRENKVGTEEGARLLRYQALQKNAGGMKIATAHNINDCLETTLINLTRGTALRGLCSIPPVRDNIVRPLIECTRQEIEDFLAENGQKYVTDSTNLKTDYTRNKMRHIVVPEMLKVNPNLYKSYGRTISILSDEDRFLESLAERALTDAFINENVYDRKKLSQNDRVIINRCISKLLKNNHLECNTLKIDEISQIVEKTGKINLSGDVYAVANEATICICHIKNENSREEKVIDRDGDYAFLGKTIRLCKQNINYVKKEANINKKFANAILDYDKIQGTVILRNRRDGDRIKFAGKPFTTRIKKLFNKDVPLEMRDSVAFLADDTGVIFVEGYGIGQGVSVDESTKNVLSVNILEGTEYDG